MCKSSTKRSRSDTLSYASERSPKLGRDAILSRGVLWRLFYCRGNRAAGALVEASNMTFQRKYENAFKQKAVAMVLQKERKVTEIGPILGINEFLIDEWKRHFHPSLTRPRAGDFYGRIRPD
jgi:hypothetical protein